MRIGNKLKALGWAAAFAAPAFSAAPPTTAGIDPTWVESRHPFTLVLSGQSGHCAPVFSHSSSRLTGGTLVLTVLEQQTPGVACTNDLSWEYRTEFEIPGLDSGAYPVQVRWAQACEFDPAPCPVAYQPVTVGNLSVTDSARLSYSIAPGTARGGQPFHLRLFAGRFNCGDQVQSATVQVTRPTIRLNYQVESHPEILCIAPFPGIDFAMPALNAGGWQVYAYTSPNCGVVQCGIGIAPQLAGALEVTQGIEAVVPLRPRTPAGPINAGRPGFRSEWNGALRDAIGKAIGP
jgi:hypothetical protein